MAVSGARPSKRVNSLTGVTFSLTLQTVTMQADTRTREGDRPFPTHSCRRCCTNEWQLNGDLPTLWRYSSLLAGKRKDLTIRSLPQVLRAGGDRVGRRWPLTH